ncbi:MAG: hypothetical protein VYC91_07185 [Acidobacteriota bacterium]|nr:hypothetical protein [Acidobacteriota bacterium]
MKTLATGTGGFLEISLSISFKEKGWTVKGSPLRVWDSTPPSPFNSLLTLGPYLAPLSLTENTYTALAAWEEDIINGPVPGIGFPSLSFVNNRCCSSFSAGKMTGDDLRVEKLRMQLLSQFVIFYFAFE